MSPTGALTAALNGKAKRARAVIAFTFVGALVYFELAGGRSYFDEILCLVSVLYLIYLALKDVLSRDDTVSILLLFFLLFIGFASNVFSGINRSAIAILIDAIAETKVLFIFFAAKYLFRNGTQRVLSDKLIPLAKVFILIAFICGLITQVVNIGMTESERYGLQGFRFIFPFSFQFLAVMLVLIGALALGTDVKHRFLYYVLASISLMLATKSSPLLFGLLFLVLYHFFNHRANINLFFAVFVCAGIFLVGTYQIETYLLNDTAPRYLFFYHGAEIANAYFPLGSGFATFGSDQAARDYSPLYYQFGFSHFFGMNPEDGSFLSDTFWPMAIGQFGWFGFFILLVIYLRIFLSFRHVPSGKNGSKAFLYAAFVSYMIHAVGSAILSSSSGVIGFIALAMVASSCEEHNHRL